MPRSWALGDFIATLFDRRSAVPSQRSLAELCAALYSGHGEVSGLKLAGAVLDRLERATPEELRGFFRLLAEDYDLDPQAVRAAADAYAETPDAAHLAALHAAAEPRRQELLRRLNQAPGATATLVRLRVALLAAAREEPLLKRVDLDFRHLFASWFNRGFLELRQIGWDSPAALLEKLIAYEAVHRIHDWDDLRLRVQPADRRCFAFFHPSMPDEPLIFVEVALTRGIPGAIAPILAPDRAPIPPAEADTAVFYSISNCQEGLRGISFGNSLIKQVVSVLSAELPQLATFVTLSPIPGLNAWIEAEGLEAETATPEGLRALAARFLLSAKGRDGLPRDPVARFHLGNGAQLAAVHAGADTSARGLAQSHGAMVNYLYDPSAVEANHEAFTARGEIAAAPALRQLAGLEPRPSVRSKR